METVKEFDMKEYNKKYYLDNKEKKFTCADCGGKYGVFTKSHHEKTKKHIKKIAEKENKKLTVDQFQKMLISTLLDLGCDINKLDIKV
jgi:hypothetical protein